MAEQLLVYEIEDFEGNDGQGSFYVNTLSNHLRKHPFVTKPHRHGFYIIVYFTAGTGAHTIDFVNYDVSPGSVFFLLPGQVHHWSLSADTEGRILFFKRDFIEDYFNKKLSGYSLFYSRHQQLDLGESYRHGHIAWLMKSIEDEFVAEVRDMVIIRDFVDILMLILGRMQHPAGQNMADPGIWNIRKLEELVEQHYSEHRPPAYYAEALNMSVKYLNELCKKYLNKTTSQIIHERIILEAKRLLTHQNLSIKEISVGLNFEDHAYFTRLFKKMTGKTPGEFRQT